MTSAARIGTATLAAAAIIGESEPVRRMRAMIEMAARTSLSVLIEGPTGAGKELVACSIHEQSGRPGAFVPFNVCAISDAMFEDALFGHVRGAFTGAIQDSAGFLREADRGSVFLDEISGLPPLLQAKLLRAVETGVYRPVGAKRDTCSDFRVVAATNECIDTLVQQGRFRADFAHRISAITIAVPGLAERVDDVPMLASHFLVAKGCVPRLSRDVVQVLCDHDWPGNVRELKQVVEWVAVMGNGELHACMLRGVLASRTQRAFAGDDRDVLERRNLLLLLDRHGGDTLAAAAALGVHRGTLYRRMKRLGIRADSRDSARIAAHRSESTSTGNGASEALT